MAMPPQIRSCSRCGADFRTSVRELVCPNCRKKSDEITEPSFREWQIIDRVRRALPNKEIAYELHLSEGTVKEYMNRIFRKLGIASRTELAVWATIHTESVQAGLNRKRS